jgi:hypothetical protein
MSEPWFGPKAYGIGLSPKSRPGWAALAIYIVAMAATGPIVDSLDAPSWVIWAVFAALTTALLALVFIKSDRQPWRWRWGGS